MPVNLTAPDPASLLPVPGVRLGVTMAGVRKANRRDLSVIALDEGAAVAAFAAFGLSPAVGLILALTRRSRDLLWCLVGLGWLAWRWHRKAEVIS